jgi:hypothetical protein
MVNKLIEQGCSEIMNDIFRRIIYYGEEDDYFETLLKYEKEALSCFDFYVEYFPSLITVYITEHSSVKLLKIGLDKSIKFNLFSRQILLMYVICHNKLELADIIINKLSEEKEEKNTSLKLSLHYGHYFMVTLPGNHKLKNESIDYLKDLVLSKKFEIDESSIMSLFEYSKKSKNIYLENFLISNYKSQIDKVN